MVAVKEHQDVPAAMLWDIQGSHPKECDPKSCLFQAPVSLNRRTFLADRHSFTPRVMDMGGTNWYAPP